MTYIFCLSNHVDWEKNLTDVEQKAVVVQKESYSTGRYLLYPLQIMNGKNMFNC